MKGNLKITIKKISTTTTPGKIQKGEFICTPNTKRFVDISVDFIAANCHLTWPPIGTLGEGDSFILQDIDVRILKFIKPQFQRKPKLSENLLGFPLRKQHGLSKLITFREL